MLPKSKRKRTEMSVSSADKHWTGFTAGLTSLLIQDDRHKAAEDNRTFITLIQTGDHVYMLISNWLKSSPPPKPPLLNVAMLSSHLLHRFSITPHFTHLLFKEGLLYQDSRIQIMQDSTLDHNSAGLEDGRTPHSGCLYQLLILPHSLLFSHHSLLLPCSQPRSWTRQEPFEVNAFENPGLQDGKKYKM